jgi:hypothetical protein
MHSQRAHSTGTALEPDAHSPKPHADAANAITVDKPPASLWIMVLSARIFGVSSFSMLLPQALMGVGTVALTYATVKRWSGAGAAQFQQYVNDGKIGYFIADAGRSGGPGGGSDSARARSQPG